MPRGSEGWELLWRSTCEDINDWRLTSNDALGTAALNATAPLCGVNCVAMSPHVDAGDTVWVWREVGLPPCRRVRMSAQVRMDNSATIEFRACRMVLWGTTDYWCDIRFDSATVTWQYYSTGAAWTSFTPPNTMEQAMVWRHVGTDFNLSTLTYDAHVDGVRATGIPADTAAASADALQGVLYTGFALETVAGGARTTYFDDVRVEVLPLRQLDWDLAREY